MNTFIVFEDGTSVFIDGGKCCENNDWKGDPIFYSKSGKRITPYTYLKWASYTSRFRQMLIYLHHDEIDDPIVEMTSTCKKCGKEFSPYWDIPNF